MKAARPAGLCFGLIELCGGAGVVAKELARLGFVCGPAFIASYSNRYDIPDKRVPAWVVRKED